MSPKGEPVATTHAYSHRKPVGPSGRHVRWGARLACGALLATLATPLVGQTPSAHAADQPPQLAAGTPATTEATVEPSAVDVAHADALQEAQNTGEPTVVDTLTTERSQVVAQPDGTFTLSSSMLPVRVRDEAGEWQPIDTTLRRTATGAIAPTHTAVDMAFSAGGDDPLLRVSNDGNQAVEFSWPTELPEPILAGNTATYSNVLPDVDLKLMAYPNGYGQVLVVKNAEAAANPALQGLTFDTDTTGVTLTENEHGGLSAVGPTGKPVFAGPAPYMWDSTDPDTHDDAAEPASAQSTGTGNVTEIGLTVDSTGQATLTPPVDALTGPDVDYPVYIDPVMTRTEGDAGSHTLTVHQAGWNYYDHPTEALRVGYCGWYTGSDPCRDDRQLKSRSYVSFNIDAIRANDSLNRPGATVFSAKVTLKQTHSAANCSTATPTQLWTAGDFVNEPSNRTWPGPRGRWLATDSSAASNDCTPGYLTYNQAAVKDYVQDTAAISSNHAVRFNLSAVDESDRMQWKKLDFPTLEVKYNFRPKTPWGLDMSEARQCSGEKRYIDTPNPTLEASSYNYARDFGLNFQLFRTSDGETTRWNKTPIVVDDQAEDGRGYFQATGGNSNNTAELSDGTFRFRAQATTFATDGTPDLTSAWNTSDETFTLDRSGPVKPYLASLDYPRDFWGATDTAPGTFKLVGTADTQAFYYSIDTSNGQKIPHKADCSRPPANLLNGSVLANDTSGDATLRLPESLPVGPHKLYIKAVDEAGNASDESTEYPFYVSRTLDSQGTKRIRLTNPEPLPRPDGNPDPYPVSTGTHTDNYYTREYTKIAAGGPSDYQFIFHVPSEATYALGVEYLTQPTGGQIEFALNGRPLVQNGGTLSVDTYAAGAAKPGFADLGAAHLSATSSGPPATVHRLTVKVVGKNSQSTDYHALLTNLYLVPLSNINYGSLEQAINFVHAEDDTLAEQKLIRLPANNAIAPDYTPADINPSSANYGMPQGALADPEKGFESGMPIPLNGVTFNIPEHNITNGADNIIAAGQTIKYDDSWGPRNAKAINVLANVTCGTMLESAKIGFNTSHDNYDDHDNDPSTPDIPVMTDHDNNPDTPDVIETVKPYYQTPRVPSWLDATTPTRTLTYADDQVASVSRVLQVDHFTDKGTPRSTSKPAIYHIRLPIHRDFWSDPIQAITLPYLASSLRGACDTANLHIYAIATSN